MCGRKGRAPAWENTSLAQSLQDHVSRGSKWITVAHAWVGESTAWVVICSIDAPLISWFWLRHSTDPCWVCSPKVFTLRWRTSRISQWIPAEKQQTQIWRMQSPGRVSKPSFPITNSLLSKAGRERTPGRGPGPPATFHYLGSEGKEKKIDGASAERNLRAKSCYSRWSKFKWF